VSRNLASDSFTPPYLLAAFTQPGLLPSFTALELDFGASRSRSHLAALTQAAEQRGITLTGI